MSKIWSQESMLILIEEIRSNTFMFNTKDTMYHNRNARRGVLERVKDLLQESRPNTTVEEFKSKWNSLRTQVIGEINKMKEMPSGSAGGSTSNMWCFESLLFLKDHISSRKSFSSMELPCGTEISGINAFPNIEETDPLEDIDGGSGEYAEVECQSTPTASTSNSSGASRGHKRKASESGDASSEFLKNASEVLEFMKRPKERDQYDDFGQFVASSVRALDSKKLRNKLQQKILIAIMEVKDE